MSNGEIKISKVTLWQAISGILFVLLLISIFTHGFGFGGDNTPTAAAAAQPAEKPAEQPAAEAPAKIELSKIKLEGVAMLGEEDAPVTIVVYDDFQCPFCARFETQVWPQIKTNYLDTGKIKFYYKHFPLGFHPNAQPASEATECAADQGKFWELHDKIFANQQELSVEKLTEWAEELELDMDKFNDCMDTNKYEERVKADMTEGQSLGVRGTPSFVVQDELLVGAQPFDKFKAVIDAKLG